VKQALDVTPKGGEKALYVAEQVSARPRHVSSAQAEDLTKTTCSTVLGTASKPTYFEMLFDLFDITADPGEGIRTHSLGARLSSSSGRLSRRKAISGVFAIMLQSQDHSTARRHPISPALRSPYGPNLACLFWGTRDLNSRKTRLFATTIRLRLSPTPLVRLGFRCMPYARDMRAYARSYFFSSFDCFGLRRLNGAPPVRIGSANYEAALRAALNKNSIVNHRKSSCAVNCVLDLDLRNIQRQLIVAVAGERISCLSAATATGVSDSARSNASPSMTNFLPSLVRRADPISAYSRRMRGRTGLRRGQPGRSPSRMK
jgi:hypothetical protein